MEQVWRDLTFSPPPPPISSPQQSHNGDNDHVVLQDFFGLNHSSKNTSGTSHPDDLNNEVPTLAPPTSLSWNHAVGPNFVPSSANYFSDVALNSGIFSFCPNYNYSNHIMNKRVLAETCSGVDGDRRHKRMMKNREAAARSRARKQAYTNELELEVAHLAEENAKLKKQHEELSLAMATQHSTKKTLQRTLTAPF